MRCITHSQSIYPLLVVRRIRHYSLMLTVIFVIAAAFPRFAVAQKTGSVTCTISDDTGPLPGAVVRVKGTDNAAVSDLDGKASIAGINSTVTLVVTLLGYEDQQIEAGPGDNISVTLKEDRQMLDEVIVIGYGTAKRKDYTGSVASVRLENSPIAQAVNSNALESLKGNVSGLDIGATNTAGGQPSVQVRGQKNFSGASSPLIVLDGLIFMGGLNDINPADIATIDILKDASSAATYGSRSANGVIVITTKKGASHKPTITFNASYGAATWGNKPRMKTGQAYVDAIMARNNRTDLGWMSPQEYLNYQTGQTTDWLDYSSRIGSKQDYQLSVGGAGEGINYYFSTSWSDNKGIIIGDDFNRFNLLGKLSTDITSWLNVSVDAAFTRQDYSGVAANILTAYYLSPYGAPYRYNTTELEKYPVTSSDGYQNPLWQADKTMRQDVDIRNNYRLQASAVIKAPWVEGLSLRLNYSYTDTRKNTSDFRNERYAVQEGRYDDDSRYSSETYTKLLSSASGWRKNEDTYSRLFDAILNYTHAFGKHDVDATLVATRDHSVYNMEQMTASNFYANGNTTLGINGLRKATVQKVSEDGVETANIGYLARVLYNYDGRYSFTGSIRRDGASVFGTNKKWGNFWSLGVAWTPSKEAFWTPELKRVVTDLKIKASGGVNGNQTLAAYSTLSKVVNGQDGGIRYEWNTSEILYGMAITSLGNDNLGWEATTAYNLGIEANLFEGRLDVDLETYYSQTKDQIFDRTIPSMTGFETVKSTMGQVDNFGIEATIHSVNIRTRDFQWSSGLTFWLNRNKLVHLYYEDLDGDGREDDDISNSRFIGKSLGAIFGYVQDGIVQTGDVDYIGVYGGVPGSPKYVDINQDDQINADDRVILGYTSPNFRLNLSNTITYKQFELYAMIAGIFGGANRYLRENQNAFRVSNVTGYATANLIDIPWWTEENPSNIYPSATFSTDGRFKGLQDRTFVRLQDITLSYTFKKSLMERWHMNNLKVFISGKNLLTFTRWVGDDPETGSSVLSSTMPVSKSVTAGVSLSF